MRKHFRYSPLRLSCFSPPVMIATFLLEITFAFYVSWRYQMTAVTRLATMILFFLAVFQLAEYNVCEGSFGVDSLSWSRLGYAAITMLPPLGLHLAMEIAGKRNNRLLAFAYAGAAAFVGFFAFTGHGITSQACLGNYVIFQAAPGASFYYATYYYGWLLFGTSYALHQARRASHDHVALSLRSLAVGYALFIIPTTIVNVVDPSTIKGIPSIMCGFAVLLACMLVARVLPAYFRTPPLRERMGELLKSR